MTDGIDATRVEVIRPGLARDTALLLAAQVYYRAGGFVVLMVLSRTLAGTDLGVYLFALASAEAFVVVASFALDRVLMRRVAVAPECAARAISAVMGFRIAASPVYLASILAVAWFSDWTIWPVMVVVAAITLGECVYLSFSCLFLAVDRVDLSVKIGVTIQTLFLAVVVVAMWQTPSVETFLVVCGVRVVALIGAGAAVSSRNVATVGLGWDGSLIREAIPFALLAFVMVIQDRADVLVVGWFTDYGEVARYSLALRAVVASLFLPLAVGQVWYPHLARLGPGPDSGRVIRRGVALLLLLGCAVMVGVGAWLGPVTTLLYGPLGPEVEPVLRLALPLFPLQFAAVFLGLALQAISRERTVLIIFALGAALGLALELVLVPRIGVTGAVAGRLAVAAGQLAVLMWVTARAVR